MLSPRLPVCLTSCPIPARLDARHQPHHYRPCLSVAERRAGMSPSDRAPAQSLAETPCPVCVPIADSPFARDLAAPRAFTGRAEATIAVSLIRLISVYNHRRPPLSTACSPMSPRLFSVSPASLALTSCASRAAHHLLMQRPHQISVSFVSASMSRTRVSVAPLTDTVAWRPRMWCVISRRPPLCDPPFVLRAPPFCCHLSLRAPRPLTFVSFCIVPALRRAPAGQCDAPGALSVARRGSAILCRSLFLIGFCLFLL